MLMLVAMSPNNVSWQSISWSDGARYEGLVKGDECDIRGVVTFASGDRYQGEFVDNAFEGDGVYVWRSGTIYRGKWRNNMMHGCGVKLSKQPNGRFIAEEGEFHEDEWKGETRACTIADARKAAMQADLAAEMAKAFELNDPPRSANDASPVISTTRTTPETFVKKKSFRPGTATFPDVKFPGVGKLVQAGKDAVGRLPRPEQAVGLVKEAAGRLPRPEQALFHIRSGLEATRNKILHARENFTKEG